MRIRQASRIGGTIIVPGDKSISHRAALLAAMASGETRIENFSSAADCQTTLRCLQQLGVNASTKGLQVVIEGVGKTGFRPSGEPIDCGNSGTTARLLAGILAGQEFDSVLTGDASLRSRPMKRVIEPLCRMGASIDSADGRLPITIIGGQRLSAVDHELKVASAQVKSCLLFAGLLAAGTTTVQERVTTRDHTERMLAWLGVDVEKTTADDTHTISIRGNAVLKGRDITIPGDISSAAYFMTAAAILPHSYIVIPGIGLNPTRNGVVEILRRAGAEIREQYLEERCNEPVGTVTVFGGLRELGTARPILLSGNFIPGIIDELPVLAILGTQFSGGMQVREAGELRLKETDRISGIVDDLRRMSAKVEELPDGFTIEKSALKGAMVESFGDHRIAMAFAIAGLQADSETLINDADCVDISFPGFFDVLEGAVDRN